MPVCRSASFAAVVGKRDEDGGADCAEDDGQRGADGNVYPVHDKHFDADEWGLANILKAADKRIGKRRLQILAKNKKNEAMQKVVQARLNSAADSKTPEFKREI